LIQKYYFYKLTVDDGGAPCVQDETLSLAICKPMIRSTAQVGDIIFGFASNSLHADNRLIYVAKITDKLTDGAYYKDSKYATRADCIYKWQGKTYHVRPRAKFHNSEKNHLTHDLGEAPLFSRANVLLSTDFRYFGGSLAEHYKQRFRRLENAIANLGQGHRVHHSPELIQDLQELLEDTMRKKQPDVQPSQPPRYDVSHRGGGCGIAKSKEGC
jgi:hypothetical protein